MFDYLEDKYEVESDLPEWRPGEISCSCQLLIMHFEMLGEYLNKALYCLHNYCMKEKY